MKKYKFKAAIVGAGGGGGACVLFPYDVEKEETRLNRMAKAVEMLRGGVKTPG